MIKLSYDGGSNGPVKVFRKARKYHKHVSEMSAQEIMVTGFGMFR